MQSARERVWYPAMFLCISSLSCTIEPPPPPIPPPAPTITIEPSVPFSIAVGGVDTVLATVTGLATDVAYSSSNPGVATVNATTGAIQARSLGTSTIRATAVADPTVTVTVQVTVVPAGPTHAQMIGNLINEVCPNEQEHVFADSVPIDADLRVVHEFHDCQRLIRNNKYESLAGIFAHRNVTTFASPVQYNQGVLAALIINFRTKTNWMAYEPLGLAPGTNCLILKFTPSAIPSRPIPPSLPRRQTVRPGRDSARTIQPSVLGTWQAAIVHRTSPTSSYGDCSNGMNWDTVDATPAGQKYMLTVKPQPPGWEPDGVGLISPPVARWDWDSISGQNYLGVRCGQHGWCEIGGNANFTPYPALTAANGKSIFKGYYDQQYLADPNGAKSDVWGTVRPGADAVVRGRIKRDGIWYNAAQLELIGPATGSTAFSFYTGKLFMPIVVDAVTQQRRGQGVLTMQSPPADVGKDWNVKVNGVDVGGGKMVFRGHPSEAYARFATVRWRWNEDDETVWSFCEEAGCCEMKPL